MRDLTSTANGLREFLNRHREWLFDDGESTFYLLSSEIRVDALPHGLSVEFLAESGVRSVAFEHFEIKESRLVIEIADQIQHSGKAEFLPRVRATEFREGTEQARLAAVNEIASRFARQNPKFKPLRVALNDHNGRYAEIVARCGLRYIAVLADVTGAVRHEALLSKALLWFRMLNARKSRRVSQIWIVANKNEGSGLEALLGCLNPSDSAPVTVWRPRNDDAGLAAGVHYEKREGRKFNSLWSGSLPRLSLLRKKEPTEFAARLLRANPGAVDLVNTAQGETIRFRGLPFARTRVIGGKELVWFGTEAEKQVLDGHAMSEFLDLVNSLKTNRRFDAPNKQHEYFRSAPEAWLESILRRNIKRLDANLILSPIYNQFRAAREKIDLLALRKDGRLIIIELKIAPDRDMVFQAVDYWRKVESQRRRGNLEKLNLFGRRKIADRSAQVYLVAPVLGFHADLQFFADRVRKEIEIFRFDLAGNWREAVKVLRRERM